MGSGCVHNRASVGEENGLAGVEVAGSESKITRQKQCKTDLVEMERSINPG